MTSCPWGECPTELQRVTPSERDAEQLRGLTDHQLGVARHLMTVHQLTPASAADHAARWLPC